GNDTITRFECSVFDGHYVTGDVDAQYLERVDSQRNDLAKKGGDASVVDKTSQVIGIHNNTAD
ncbi:MAG: amidophosphoribosyltransferase, partial [Porticoccaceae bacterium]|nr:amidophosphoribosyltransferase [Porticoccaceae bacterium]